MFHCSPKLSPFLTCVVGANTEFQYECLSLDTTASSSRDLVTGSPTPSWDSGGQVDFGDDIEVPLVKEESPSPGTVYIKCEVKKENTSDFLEDTSTDGDHSEPHSSYTLNSPCRALLQSSPCQQARNHSRMTQQLFLPVYWCCSPPAFPHR